MSECRISDLIAGSGAEYEGRPDLPIKGIAYHSAQVKPGFLFVAIDGFRASGRDFIAEAISRGAVAVAGTTCPETGRTGVGRIRTDNPRRFLALIAHRFYDFPARAVRVIGITGTNGKTTVSYLVRSIFETAGEPSGLVGTIRHFDGKEWQRAANTTPESLDIVQLLVRLRELGIKYCIAEVSSHALALERVAGLEFWAGVLTNLSRDHLDFHKTIEDYKSAKLRLFQELGEGACAIYNADDPAGREVPKVTRAQKLGYCLGAGKCEASSANFVRVLGRIRALAIHGTSLDLVVDGARTMVTTPLLGHHNVYNVLAAAGVGVWCGFSRDLIRQGIERLKAVPGRLELIPNRAGLWVFVDYAHSPDALENLILTARSLTNRRVIITFGCGGERDEGKRPQMGQIATELADYVIVTSDNPRREDPLKIINEITAGAQRDNVEAIPDRYAAIKRALFLARKGDIVLIAGKGHEDYQIVGSERRHFDDRTTVRAILGE